MGCCDTCWWVLFGWFPGLKRGFGGAARRQCPPSPSGQTASWASASGLACPWLTVCIASISCHQCWKYKDLWRLVLLVDHLKNGGAVVKRRSRRWELGAGVIGEKMKDWALLSWHWSVNSANDKRFGHFQLGAHFLYPGSFAKTLIGHPQLHLPCFGNSSFGNGIGRALGPSGLVWSSNSLCPWNDGDYYNP